LCVGAEGALYTIEDSFNRYHEKGGGIIKEGLAPGLCLRDGECDNGEDKAAPVMDSASASIEGSVSHRRVKFIEGFEVKLR